MSVLHINDTEFNEKVLSADGTVCVDFSAAWCGPCQMLAPLLEEISNETDIKIYKVDIDESAVLALSHGIVSVPTLVLFRNGEEVKREIGFLSKEELQAFLS